jgi:hypothetical protein
VVGRMLFDLDKIILIQVQAIQRSKVAISEHIKLPHSPHVRMLPFFIALRLLQLVILVSIQVLIITAYAPSVSVFLPFTAVRMLL